MLYWRCVYCSTDFHQHGFPRFAVGVEEADLDQFMSAQGAIDFLEQRGGEAFFGDAHQGRESVGAGAQGTALFGGEGVYGRHGGIVRLEQYSRIRVYMK